MKNPRLTRRLAVAVVTTAAALLGVSDPVNAQPSPVLDWDMTLAGQRRGTAQVSFYNDFTLFGYQMSTLPPVKNSSTNPRTGTVEDDNSTGTGTNAAYIGEAAISGVWSFDLLGRVIGTYAEIIPVNEGGTNYMVTNGYSFTASVNPGRSISVKAYGPAARITFRGRPTMPLANLTGSYYGVATYNGQNFTEFFSLSPTAALNIYDVTGNGSDYSYSGTAMLVRQGQLSMVTGSAGGTNAIVRSVVGGVRTGVTPFRGSLTGSQTGVPGNVRFRLNP